MATTGPDTPLHRVVIVGGGFAGLETARRLKRAPVDVTLLDRRNFHLFQPLLYQVATSGLSPGDIASPIRRLLRRQPNTRVLLGHVDGIDLAARTVSLDGEPIGYDSLVLAAGSDNHYFGHDDWAEWAPGLKTVEDATLIRTRILAAFEAAEREPDAERRRAWLTFPIVGAGPTGVELAGALSELARDALEGDFRRIDSRDAEVLLIEAGDQVLPSYPVELARKAQQALERLGVRVRLGCMVQHIDGEGLLLECDGKRERIATRCPLWAAGVAPSPLAREVAEQAGLETDRQGRVPVGEHLTLAGHPEVWVIGDMAHCEKPEGGLVPGVAPAAIQQGRHAGDAIRRRLEGRPLEPFRYRHKGDLATIGRSAGVADFGRLRFSGPLAWLLWLVVHIAFLVGLENRALVLLQWLWSYVTRNRSTRLIAHAAVPGAEELRQRISSAA